jgi:hypothetical protein
MALDLTSVEHAVETSAEAALPVAEAVAEAVAPAEVSALKSLLHDVVGFLHLHFPGAPALPAKPSE